MIFIRHISSQARGVEIFNFSFALEVFLKIWKKAEIVSVKKTEILSLVSDFRLIAQLCLLSKIFEKVAQRQILEFLTRNNLLAPLQASFQRHHCIQTALLKLTDNVRIGMERKQLTQLLLLNFSKAFDTMSHFWLE